MKLGIDISTYPEVTSLGAKFYCNNLEVDPIDIFTQNGVTISRIRVWLNPYENEKAYLGGTCDEENFSSLALSMQQKGYEIMLCLHYSDFWADPSKQLLPKSWKNLSFDKLKEQVYLYTADLLQKCKEKNIELKYIQIGNEITNGMLWPYGYLDGENGKRKGFDKLFALLKQASRACREFSSAEIVVHVERPHLKELHIEFFENAKKYNFDYDVIGFSYYPYWHGTLEMLEDSIVTLREKFEKNVYLVEVGYGFTSAPYLQNTDTLVIGEQFLSGILWELPEPLTAEGQERYVERLLNLAKRLDIPVVIYWEPLWIPGKNICWASEEALKYTGETTKNTANEWANQCLFDYNGNALPALKKFRL